jgi:ABC-2 type transport system permease protein
MNGTLSILKREVKAYFTTPVAYVFLVIFLFFSSFQTFKNAFYEARQASLMAFFQDLPYLFLFLVPAIAMRLWAEERRTNSIEMLLTLPVTVTQAVLGKFLAAWAVLGIALALTFPLILTVIYLGHPDPGPIVAGYLGALLLAGAYLAIGSLFSALTRNQVVAFILGVVGCGLFLFAGSPTALRFVSNVLPVPLLDAMETLSFESQFEAMGRGVLELRNLIFFLVLMAGALWANVMVIEERRAA